MEYTTILAVAGCIVTIAVAIGGTVITIKMRNNPRIEVYKEEIVALFDSIAKDIEELEVLYNKDSVGTDLILFKGILFNSGRKDISMDMVERPISLELPDGFEWLPSKNAAHPTAVRKEIEIVPSALTIKTGLFRRKEFIRFQAVAKITDNNETGNEKRSPPENFSKAITVRHRITDLPEIKLTDLPRPAENRRSVRNGKWTITLGVFLITFSLVMRIMGLWPHQLVYFYATNETSIEVRLIRDIEKQFVTLKAVHSDFELKLPYEIYLIDPKLSHESKFEERILYVLIGAGMFYVIFGGCIWFWNYNTRKKMGQLWSFLS